MYIQIISEFYECDHLITRRFGFFFEQRVCLIVVMWVKDRDRARALETIW